MRITKGLQASAATAAVLAAGSTIRPVPAVLWLVWAAATAVSLVDAVRTPA